MGREVYKLKEIQRYCKTKIIAKKVPSLNDVMNTRIENIFEQAGELIEQEDLSRLIGLVEERINDEEYTAMDMAAALIKMMLGENGTVEEPDYGEFGNTGARDGMYVCSSISVSPSV